MFIRSYGYGVELCLFQFRTWLIIYVVVRAIESPHQFQNNILQNKTDNVTEAEAVVMVVMMVTVMVLCFALMLMFC